MVIHYTGKAGGGFAPPFSVPYIGHILTPEVTPKGHFFGSGVKSHPKNCVFNFARPQYIVVFLAKNYEGSQKFQKQK